MCATCEEDTHVTEDCPFLEEARAAIKKRKLNQQSAQANAATFLANNFEGQNKDNDGSVSGR